MEIIDVTVDAYHPSYIGDPIRVTFGITGAVGGFEFPFSNESLTESKIIFTKEARS